MPKTNNSAATIGFESELWRAADALRSNMDAAEYKHVVLGLIFLKYISDAFEEYHAQLLAEVAQGADPEDPDKDEKDEPVVRLYQRQTWRELAERSRSPTGRLTRWCLLVGKQAQVVWVDGGGD